MSELVATKHYDGVFWFASSHPMFGHCTDRVHPVAIIQTFWQTL